MAKPSRTSPRSTSKQSKQTGSTFLGIVLGLIVGLAIAVVVALYITRAPTPFVDKVAPPAASGAGATDQQYDPNRALQGKSPGQPVPQTAQSAPPNTAPGQSTGNAAKPNAPGLLEEPQIVEVPPAASAGNAAPPQIPQPGQQNAPAPAKKPPQPATTANAPAGGSAAAPAQQHANNAASGPSAGASAAGAGGASGAQANTSYFLQVGSYRTSADAEQQRARLAFQGFESKVTQRDAGGTTYYRVRIGPFAKFEDMNATRQRLSESGVDTAVIRFTKQ